MDHRTLLLLIPVLLIGCASNPSTTPTSMRGPGRFGAGGPGGGCGPCKQNVCPRNRTNDEATAKPDPKVEAKADDKADTKPQAAAALPEKFARMDPADAGQRGPGGIAEARDVFHELLNQHEAIERKVEDIPGGVRTVTTSENPVVAALIQLHVRQMAARFEAGMPVRRWDPIFVEMLKHYDKITLELEDIPGGLRVTETSDDPQVVLLIRQHAHRGVSEFVKRGFDRAHEETPMPEGYKR